MSFDLVPVQLQLSQDSKLIIEWSDGKQGAISLQSLRDACPCATCKEKRTQESPKKKMMILSAAEASPLKIVSMRPVGNYAYNIGFSDDHSSGIYGLELLRQLGDSSP